jgi:hypothetical protein
VKQNCLVRPQLSPVEERGEVVAEGAVGVADVEVAYGEGSQARGPVEKEEEAVGDMPVPVPDEDFGERRPKIARRPGAPTKAEIAEHYPLPRSV